MGNHVSTSPSTTSQEEGIQPVRPVFLNWTPKNINKARKCIRIQSPHIVKVNDIGETYIVKGKSGAYERFDENKKNCRCPVSSPAVINRLKVRFEKVFGARNITR